MRSIRIVVASLCVILACSTSVTVAGAENEKPPMIHTVLPKDAIRAIFEPEFVPAANVADEAAMIGVVLNNEAHAYSAVLLNSNEIVNDTVGGVPVATTW